MTATLRLRAPVPYQRERLLDALIGEAAFLAAPAHVGPGWCPAIDRLESAESVLYAAIIAELVHNPAMPLLHANHAIHVYGVARLLARWAR